VDAVTFDLRWKAACGLSITAAGFHSTTLTYWRRQLAASRRPDRFFEAVKTTIARDRGASCSNRFDHWAIRQGHGVVGRDEMGFVQWCAFGEVLSDHAATSWFWPWERRNRGILGGSDLQVHWACSSTQGDLETCGGNL